jgi:DnaJ-class molecular chaperone
MNHAEICPVCGGRGKVMSPVNSWTTAVSYEQTCHGCSGCGWVTVKDHPGFHDVDKFYPDDGRAK